MYPIPSAMRINSPIVTASGGVTVKKTFIWSAGAVKKRNAASITAKTPATFGLRNTKAAPRIGSSKPTIVKYTAIEGDRKSGSRVSNPKGVKRKPTTNPTASKAANIRFVFLREVCR